MSANHITITTDQQPPAAAVMSEKAPTTSSSHTLNPGNATPGNISREATWRQHDVHAPSRQPTAHSLDLDDYFAGPRDVRRHSKYPYFMRLHGSVLPKMIIPLTFVGVWATVITCITQLKISKHSLGVNSILLTVLGFVVGLALSFRSTTAYERYNDGRRYWSQLSVTSRNLARLIWIHVEERHAESEELGKKDLLEKLSAINLINAFAVSLKHRLRFEPATEYPDLEPLINHLTTMAGSADQAKLRKKTPTPWKAAGEYLGIPFAESNPRKLIKRSRDNLGNLPLEIITHLAAYMDHVFNNKTLVTPVHQTWAMTNIGLLGDVLSGTERVLNTPIPIAYTISISQITWVYVMVLPFQLQDYLKWVTIPGTIIGAYIILGLAAIGKEVENPFGNDVNDLPLDDYCREIASEIDILTSMPPPNIGDWMKADGNMPLFPLSMTDYEGWEKRSVDDIRDALRAKATTNAKSVQIERVKTMYEGERMTQVV